MKSGELRDEAEAVLSEADMLYTAAEVDAALDKMAADIQLKLETENPLILCPMIGGIVITGQLLTKLVFPLEVDYVHATRYRGETTGKDLLWFRKPQKNVTDRTVLILDDILDQGITLEKIKQACAEAGARQIYTGVLIEKKIDKPRDLQQADFTGLMVPDRYVFGYGMDYKGYLRNCRGIYAVRQE